MMDGTFTVTFHCNFIKFTQFILMYIARLKSISNAASTFVYLCISPKVSLVLKLFAKYLTAIIL
jgi:hypothetical protein